MDCSVQLKYLVFTTVPEAYPKIFNVKFRYALRTFKQQLVLKCGRVVDF